MDKLRAMEVFAQVVERGSLTAAAEALDMSPPAVVRALAALEQSIGARLLHRTTRRQSLSDEGREYYEGCKRVLAEVEEADALLSARRISPRGRLRITAPVMYGRLHVAQRINRFLARYPGVEVELLLLDRVIDLVAEGIDAGIRIGHLPDSTLVAKRIGETRRVICAAPIYLKRAGMPKTPDALAKMSTIVFSGLSPGHEWVFAGKPPLRITIKPRLRTNQIDAAIEACLAGLGCGQFLCYQVNALIAAGRLKRVLNDHEPPSAPISIVYPSARLVSANLRALLEFFT
ncbi:MAG: LysR family transcriptional regulator [Alphaproteobacteria bacterium]|nr:LysR family transcriptional regulator [Alphaproteobacteria bacterium]